MQQGIYIPASINRKFHELPSKKNVSYPIVPPGMVLCIYVEYCTWKLWNTKKEDPFQLDDSLQYHIIGNSTLLQKREIAEANRILLEFRLIEMKGSAVVDVKVFRPGRRFQ